MYNSLCWSHRSWMCAWSSCLCSNSVVEQQNREPTNRQHMLWPPLVTTTESHSCNMFYWNMDDRLNSVLCRRARALLRGCPWQLRPVGHPWIVGCTDLQVMFSDTRLECHWTAWGTWSVALTRPSWSKEVVTMKVFCDGDICLLFLVFWLFLWALKWHTPWYKLNGGS